MYLYLYILLILVHCYKDKLVNAESLFILSDETHEYTVWTKCRICDYKAGGRV